MPLDIALGSAQQFFTHLRSVRGPLFLSLASAVVLALPQQSIEIYRSIAQSGSFADVGQRRRELAVLALALALLSGVVWLCARFSTRPVWRTLRPGSSLPTVINILIALLPLLGVAIGCYRAQTLPLAPAAREAVATTLRNIVLAGGGNPTPALIDETLPPLLDYNQYLLGGTLGFLALAALMAGLMGWLEFAWLRRTTAPPTQLPRYLALLAGAAAAAGLFLLPPLVATVGGPLFMFAIFAASAAIVLSALCYVADRTRLPLVGALVVYVALISFFELNDNHRAFALKAASARAPSESLPQLEDQFRRWLQARKDRDAFPGRRYPVYIAAVQGGGIYAAYHASSVLAALQDSCPAFARHLFAVSGVSGGSLGAAVFTTVANASYHRVKPDAAACLDADRLPLREADGEFSVVRVTEQVLEADYLAPVTYGLLVSDLVQLFAPRQLGLDDRARQLELALESKMSEVLAAEFRRQRLSKLPANLLRERYTAHWSPTGDLPALVLNTTEVGTGGRRIIAPFRFGSDDSTFLPLNDPELAGVPLSTAAILSARFPWLTPPGWYAERSQQGSFKNHLVDGGYYDNSGVATALDVFRVVTSLPDLSDEIDVRLLILSSPHERAQATFFGIELLAPVRALLRVRAAGARRTIAQAERELGVDTRVNARPQILRADLLDFGYPLPLGWRLSRVSAMLIEAQNGLSEPCTAPGAQGRAACLLEAVRHDLTRRRDN